MRLSPILMIAASVAGGCAAEVRFDCGDAPMCDILEVTTDTRRRASNVVITRIAIAQGVHTDIMSGGAAVEPVVPIVRGRDAILRVFYEPINDYVPRDITARVTFFQNGEVVGAAQASKNLVGVSSMEDMASTLNIRIDGAMLAAGELEYEVELLEDVGVNIAGDRGGAIFPPRGALPAAMNVEDGGESLRVYLVPVSWDEDGSGQLPVTNAFAIQTFRDELYSIFPVADVEIEVGEPMPWGQRSTITSQTLQAVQALREERNIPSDQYIYGLLNPSIGSGGGAAGLSYLAGVPKDAGQRASIGLSMQEGAGASTMAHEIGHAHGRSHTPGCGAAGADENYPHEDSSIGTYGYDLIEDSLMGPETYKDLMSYCGPEFISDYNYIRFFKRQKGIFEEVLGGGGDGDVNRSHQAPWRRIWLHTDGEITDGGVAWMHEQPIGEPMQVELDGQVVSGVLAPFSHADGGVLYVPTEAPVETLRVADGPIEPVELFRR